MPYTRPKVHSFVHWLVRSFVRLSVRSFVRSFIGAFVRSLVRSFVRWLVRSFVSTFRGSFVRAFVRFSVRPFLRSLVGCLVRSFVRRAFNQRNKFMKNNIFDKLSFVLFLTDEANTIHLKCDIAPFSDSCAVLDHQVPVFICDKDALASSEWDITTQQVDTNLSQLKRKFASLMNLKTKQTIAKYNHPQLHPALHHGLIQLEKLNLG